MTDITYPLIYDAKRRTWYQPGDLAAFRLYAIPPLGRKPGRSITRGVVRAVWRNQRTGERRIGLYLHSRDDSRYPAGQNTAGRNRRNPR